MAKKIRVAMYSRVSTDGQNPDGQESEMKEYAKNRGWGMTRIYRDKMSGAKASRPALDELMADARKRQMDIVLVWRFDRFARSVSHLLQALESFRTVGIEFASLSEQGRPPIRQMSPAELAKVRADRATGEFSLRKLAKKYGTSVWAMQQATLRQNWAKRRV
jgi:DNA invertase Pin-like site-specific DNA recombinase